MKNDGFNDVYKMLKNSRTKLGAIPAARLEYEKETEAADVADRVLPHLRMPTPQEIAMHPWWGGGLAVLQSLLAAKLMKNVSEEKKRNRTKAVQLLDKTEREELTEREKLNLLVNRMQARYEEKAKLEQEIGKANIAKLTAETRDIGSKAGLKRLEIDADKEKHSQKTFDEAEKGRKKSQKEQIAPFEKNMSPEERLEAHDRIENGEFNINDLIKQPPSFWNNKPWVSKIWGNNQNMYKFKKKEGAPKGKVKVMLSDDEKTVIGM
jgi:hypothetical protein